MKAVCSLIVVAFGLAVLNSGSHYVSAQEQDRESVLFGVHTTFTINPPKISHKDKMSISLTMTNMTKQAIVFKYISGFQNHIDVFTKKGERIPWKAGAPISEAPYIEIRIDAGRSVQRTEKFRFGDYYSVPPGSYVLRFKYDKRLMEGGSVKNPWVSWTKTGFNIEVEK